jgi:hypothetical protein
MDGWIPRREGTVVFGYHDHAIMTASGASNQKVGTSGAGRF